MAYKNLMKENIYIPGKENDKTAVAKEISALGPQPFAPWFSIVVDHKKPSDRKQYKSVKKLDEYDEAKGTLIWIPLIKRVVYEAGEYGIIHKKHVPLFENILFGLTAVEACGRFAQTGNFGNSKYQKIIGSFRGLGQMVAEKHYLEENPYDPLTALRMSLRNMIYFVYKGKNVEAALAEHNNGKIGIIKSRVGVDAFATIGQEFVLRVVNAAWWGHYLIEKNDYYTGSENYHHQWDIQHPNTPYYHYAPPWDFHKLNKKGKLVIQEPDLPFNWKPPASSNAYRRLNTIPGLHFKQKIRNLILRPIHRNVWADNIVFRYPVHKDPGKDKSRCQKVLNGSVIILKGIKIPDWFYTASIAPAVLPLKLQVLTKNHELIYPRGIKGKTPASSGKRHNLFLEDGDPLKDSIGKDRNGRWYCYTRKSFKRE